MIGSPSTLVESIQVMVAPAVMISASALLLLGMNNKYSAVLGRIRGLNEERRHLLKNIKDGAADKTAKRRLDLLSKELTKLFGRSSSVRHAALSYYCGVALFVVTSLCIGLAYYFSIEQARSLAGYAFVLGMVSIFSGAFFGACEVIEGYGVLQLEVFGLAPRCATEEESMSFYDWEEMEPPVPNAGVVT